MATFHAYDEDYRVKAQALRSMYPDYRYSPVPLHRRRCRIQHFDRTRRTITIDERLWDLGLIAKGRNNTKGGTICVNLSELLEQALRSWLVASGVREEWLTHPGLLPDDWAEELAALERKREGRSKGPKRQRKPKADRSHVPPGFRSSEGEAAWAMALESWCNARNLMLLDVKDGRPLVSLGPRGAPFYLDTQASRYHGWPTRDSFL